MSFGEVLKCKTLDFAICEWQNNTIPLKTKEKSTENGGFLCFFGLSDKT